MSGEHMNEKEPAAVKARENATRGGVQMRWIIVLAMVLVFGCAEDPSDEVSEEPSEEVSEEASEAPSQRMLDDPSKWPSEAQSEAPTD